MPSRANAAVPPRLSETGAFTDTTTLKSAKALIGYDLVVPFWSDGAEKSRWISVPSGETIHFTATGEWTFPKGTVLVKHFDLVTNEITQASRRLETRLIVLSETGGVYGVTYKWRADNSDADLLATNLTEAIAIQTAAGIRTQLWYYPSRQDCLTCHTENAGFVLGPKTRQLNRDRQFESGVTDNQLRAWNHVGLFDTNLNEAEIGKFPRLAAMNDSTRSLEDRARSYLDANCANCHRPEGTVAYFDARYDTPIAQQGVIDGRVLIDERIDSARVIAPHDIWRSILLMRANTTEPFKMPPLARNEVDVHGMKLLRDWIESMPGQPVLPPPTIQPASGSFSNAVEVKLKSEPGSTTHYTTDGTVPTATDPVYETPILLTNSTILRARAFKAGFKKSIASKEIYIFGN
jgi:uncharacterized repeat protein (TIGR03806 family)